MANVYTCEQRSDEWFRLRMGIPTASMFGVVCAQKQDSKTRRTYMYKLAGERLTGEPMDSFSNRHTDRGIEREPEARAMYSVMTGFKVEQVGFISRGDCGASPDGTVSPDGLLEIKDALPHIQIERLESGEIPGAHRDQVHGQMLVADAAWCDYMSHCRGLPPFIKRVHRSSVMDAVLERALAKFNSELEQLVERIRSYA